MPAFFMYVFLIRRFVLFDASFVQLNEEQQALFDKWITQTELQKEILPVP